MKDHIQEIMEARPSLTDDEVTMLRELARGMSEAPPDTGGAYVYIEEDMIVPFMLTMFAGIEALTGEDTK